MTTVLKVNLTQINQMNQAVDNKVMKGENLRRDLVMIGILKEIMVNVALTVRNLIEYLKVEVLN